MGRASHFGASVENFDDTDPVHAANHKWYLKDNSDLRYPVDRKAPIDRNNSKPIYW